MSFRDDVVDSFRDRIVKQNPWQPYRGEAGGEGWHNVITGEIRYQDTRPEPQEGLPDEYDGEVPDIPDLGMPEEDIPRNLDELDEEMDVIPHLEEGMEIEIEGLDGPVEVDVVDIEEINGTLTAEVENENGERFNIGEGEILSHPVELEPPDGWGDNWAEPPDDPFELFSDQTVEVYDIPEGEYKQGEIRRIEEWSEGAYVDVQTQDGDVYEYLDGEPTGSGEGSTLTAAEDLIEPATASLAPGDLEYEMKGPGKLFNEHTGEIVDGEITNVSPDENTVEFVDDDGNAYLASPHSTWSLVSERGEAQVELHEADKVSDEVPGLNPQTVRGLALHDGALAEVDHPARGEITGEIDIRDHDDLGRHAYIGDSEVGIPLDDPEHPLAQIAIGDIENQWYDIDDSEALDTLDQLDQEFGLDYVPVNPGDEVYLHGEQRTVTSVDDQTNEVTLDNYSELSSGELVELADYKKPASTPDLPSDTWDHDLPDTLKYDDTITFTDGDGDLVADKVTDDYGDVIHTRNHGEVDPETVRAWADTGEAAPNRVDWADVVEGGVVTVRRKQADGGVEEFEAYVMEENTGYGVPTAELMRADGEINHLEFGGPDTGVVEADPYADAQDILDADLDWRERDAVDLADDIYSDVVMQGASHDNYLSKLLAGEYTTAMAVFWKAEMQNVKTTLMTHFPPEEVEAFYGAISDWKVDSKSYHEQEKIAEAFRRALGGDVRVRGQHEDSIEGPRPPEEWVKLADVANTMSQWYYEDTVKPRTGGQLTRDCASTSLKSFMLEWADNPDADEFKYDGRMLNNFQLSPGKWKDWRVTPSEVPTENIGLMTDFMFNPMQTNSGEDEIWVTGDDLTFGPDEVGVGTNRTSFGSDGHFGGDIDDWSDSQLETVSKEIAQYYSDLTVDEDEVYRPDELTDQQVETFLQVAERAETEGITHDDTSVRDWVDLVQSEAVERGITAPEGASDHPILDHAEQLPTGSEITVRNSIGEEIPGLVVGHTDDGRLEVENANTGHVGAFGIDDLDAVEWAGEKYGEPANVDLTDLDVEEDLDQLDEMYVWSGGDWEEGKVLDVDDGTVELSMDTQYGGTEYFDAHDITENNYAVPQDMVHTGMDKYPDPGDYVEVDVPAKIDHDAESVIAEVHNVEPDGELKVPYDDIPWLDHDKYDPITEMVTVPADDYQESPEHTVETALESYDQDGFSEGTTVAVLDSFGLPNNEVTIGDTVHMQDEMEGIVVDVTAGNNLRVHITDAGDSVGMKPGDVNTFFPSDDVRPAPMDDDDSFGAITGGFDSTGQVDATFDLSNDPETGGATAEYIDPDSGEILEGEVTATFPSMDAVHIDGVEDPVPVDHVRPEGGVTEGVDHDDVDVGTEVVVEHFDPSIGVTDGTVLGFNEDKMEYVVDLSDTDGKPPSDAILYAGTHEVEHIKGEGDVNEAAVKLVSDDDAFTQDTPGSGPDVEPGDPIDADELAAMDIGDDLMVQIAGDDYEYAEVIGFVGEDTKIEFTDGSTGTYSPDTALDFYEAVEAVEPPEEFDFEPMVAPDPDELAEYEGDWVAFQPDDDQYPEGVVGRLYDTDDAGPDGMFTVEDAQSLGDEEFPLESYTGSVADVAGVHTEGSDDTSSVPTTQLHDAGLGEGDRVETTLPEVGETEIEITETSADPSYPMLAEGPDYKYELDPDGSVERYDFEVGDPIDPTEYSVGETLKIRNVAGSFADYAVMGSPTEPDEPIELEEQPGGARYLYWPSGEVEEL